MRWAVVLVAALGVACGGEAETTPQSPAPDRVIGVITAIEPEDGHVPTSFEVEEDDGDAFTIVVDQEQDYGFDLHHVYEHFEEEDPVDVTVEVRDGDLVATAIEDA